MNKDPEEAFDEWDEKQHGTKEEQEESTATELEEDEYSI